MLLPGAHAGLVFGFKKSLEIHSPEPLMFTKPRSNFCMAWRVLGGFCFICFLVFGIKPRTLCVLGGVLPSRGKIALLQIPVHTHFLIPSSVGFNFETERSRP